MLGIACVAGSVRHGQDHSCTNGACDLDRLLDLLISGTQLLRTCEVRYRSRFAMQSQDEGQVHQLLGLGVERPSVVRLLEVIGVALAGVEVALSNIRHAYMLPRPSGLFGAARDRLKDGKSRSGSRSRRLAGGSNTTLARSTPRAPYFLKVYGLNGPEVRGHALTCLRLDIQHD